MSALPALHELIDLVLRWIHLIAGIMWIGNSMLFNWLDRNLVTPDSGPRDKLVGEIWMVHSGGFYQVEKKFLEPSGMPKMLHWFKWQSYTTWLTGAALLGVVYYSGDAALMRDPAVAKLSGSAAIAVGVGFIVGAFLIYDVLWRVVGKNNQVGVPLMLALLFGAIWGFTHLLSGRAAFLHVGALFGTLMAGNVFFHIIPSQHELIAATLAGREQDLALSYRAKQRSIHNNYLTFPLLFTMLSNHFSIAYSHPQNWLVLSVLFTGGALARHCLNTRFTWPGWKPWFATTLIATMTITFLLVRPAPPPATPLPKVAFATVKAIIAERCQPCHSATPRDTDPPLAPANVKFDTDEDIKQWATRINMRAVVGKTMPFINKTKMTDDERATLGRWFDAGASLD